MNKLVSVFVLVIFAAVTVPSYAWANGCGGGGGSDPAERKAKLQKKLWGKPTSVEDAGQAIIDALMAMVGASRRLPNGKPTNMFNIGDKGLERIPIDDNYLGGWHEAGTLPPQHLEPVLTPFDLFGYGLFVLLTPPPPEKPVIPSDIQSLDVPLRGDVGDMSVGIYGDWRSTTVSVKKSPVKPSKPDANQGMWTTKDTPLPAKGSPMRKLYEDPPIGDLGDYDKPEGIPLSLTLGDLTRAATYEIYQNMELNVVFDNARENSAVNRISPPSYMFESIM